MKKNLQTSLLYAGAIIATDTPMESRVKILSKYLDPKPNAMAEIDDNQTLLYGKKDKEEGRLYGEIEINPPKGSCFTVTRAVDKNDDEVCKKTKLKWTLKDIDKDTGKFTWTIKTGPNDFGTPITWNTPHRIAKFIPSTFEFNQESSTPLFIKSCIALPKDPKNFVGRRINLEFFNGEKWIFRFPDVDTTIPPWEPPKPTPPPEDPKKKKHDEHGGGHGEAPEPAKDEHGKPIEKEPEKPKVIEQPEAWTLSTRRGFVMDSSQVLTEKNPPSPRKGLCRYQYDAIIGNFENGKIECHYGDGYTYFIASLPCMKFLQK